VISSTTLRVPTPAVISSTVVSPPAETLQKVEPPKAATSGAPAAETEAADVPPALEQGEGQQEQSLLKKQPAPAAGDNGDKNGEKQENGAGQGTQLNNAKGEKTA
jgi:hypothetical protein